ncbi:MAG TPA: hypothetical protein DCL76_01185 [Chloroflexi bacterium]|nr:hypothetical protein [Chloroflexota bacterium]|tara:strand:+ start:2357 stop:3337 length:981 start_codon:yes stop_codon:yes gene_type:complete
MKDKLVASLIDKRIVVTGGLGFIGSNLVHSLIEYGADLAIIDSLDPRSGGDIANIHGIQDKIDLFSADICDFETVASVVQDADYVFHCAAHTSHPYSMRDPQLDVSVNCIGTLNVLEALRKLRPMARMVYVGTSTQIGPMIENPINEQHIVAPVDIYSANKAAAEYYCRIYANAYDLDINVVRLPNVYGPRANITSPDFGFINYFIGLALRDQSLTIYGKGEQLRSVIYVKDAINALILSGCSDITGKVWFAANESSVSVKELADSIVKACGSGSVINIEWPDDRKRIDVGDIVIDCSRIYRDLGWQALECLENGLKETVQYWKSR